MNPLFSLAIGAALIARLTRKLTGDLNAGLLAAAVYAFAPASQKIAAADWRAAACLAALPATLALFYRALDLPVDADAGSRRRAWGTLAAALALGGFLDTRFAAVTGFFLWAVVLIGLSMDQRRAWTVWGPLFKNLGLASVGGVLIYAPLWLMRRASPVPPPAILYTGLDFLDLWRFSSGYIGVAAALLMAIGFSFSRSYLGQARLWSSLTGLFLWASLGPRFFFNGVYLWWVPALGRGFMSVPWLRSVPPEYFGAAARCALSLAAAYGLTALYARLPLKFMRWPWFRPALGLALAALIAADYLIP